MNNKMTNSDIVVGGLSKDHVALISDEWADTSYDQPKDDAQQDAQVDK
jgi:hypothetical protein